MLGQVPEYFRLERFSVVDERRYNARGQLVTESEATVKVRVGNDLRHEVADGNGPVKRHRPGRSGRRWSRPIRS